MNNFIGTMMLLKNTKRKVQSGYPLTSKEQTAIAVAAKEMMDRQNYYRQERAGSS